MRMKNDDKDAALIEKILMQKREKSVHYKSNCFGERLRHHHEPQKDTAIDEKYHLTATIRQAKPYRHMLKATKVHSTSKNLLGRTFNQNEPGKVYLTDITYIYYGNGQKHISPASKTV